MVIMVIVNFISSFVALLFSRIHCIQLKGIAKAQVRDEMVEDQQEVGFQEEKHQSTI